MQKKYNLNNINLIFWAWCTNRQATESGMYIIQTITRETVFIPLSKNNLASLDRNLVSGISVEKFIDMFNSFGLQGEDYYVLLMQKGIIE